MKGRSVAEVLAGAVVLLVAFSFLAYAVTNSGRTSFSGPGLTLSAKFDHIDGLSPGADVRVAGVKVGSVTDQRIDPTTFLAVLTLRIDSSLRMPSDSSAEIASEGLLGGKFVSLVPGGSDRILADGGQITITQSSISLESLLGRFIFSMTSGQQPAPGGDAPAPSLAPAPGAAPARP